LISLNVMENEENDFIFGDWFIVMRRKSSKCKNKFRKTFWYYYLKWNKHETFCTHKYEISCTCQLKPITHYVKSAWHQVQSAKYILNFVANTLLDYPLLIIAIYVLLYTDLATGCNDYSFDL